MRVILASTSFDRNEILGETVLAFERVDSNYDEKAYEEPDPVKRATALGRAKALAVAGSHSDALVIAADTVIKGPNNELFEKPLDREDAKRILRLMSGKTCYVVTGHTVIHGDSGKEESETTSLALKYRELTDAEIEAYLDLNTWQANCGAMNVLEDQLKRGWIERMEGEVEEIRGLSIPALQRIIARMGYLELLPFLRRKQQTVE